MRKLILFATAALICAGLEAKNPFSITSGDVSCFKEASEATFVIDYSNATFQHEKTLQEESGDVWEERLALMNEGFVSGFNRFTKSKKGLHATLASEAATYTITLHIANIDRKVCPTLTWADQELVIDGVIDVVDNSSNATVCSIKVDGCKPSKGTPKISARITQCFDDLGFKLAKLAK